MRVDHFTFSMTFFTWFTWRLNNADVPSKLSLPFIFEDKNRVKTSYQSFKSNQNFIKESNAPILLLCFKSDPSQVTEWDRIGKRCNGRARDIIEITIKANIVDP